MSWIKSCYRLRENCYLPFSNVHFTDGLAGHGGPIVTCRDQRVRVHKSKAETWVEPKSSRVSEPARVLPENRCNYRSCLRETKNDQRGTKQVYSFFFQSFFLFFRLFFEKKPQFLANCILNHRITIHELLYTMILNCFRAYLTIDSRSLRE